MSYQDRVDRAIKLIDEFNSQIPDKSDQIDSSEFIKKLKKAGGVSEPMLQECTWEELQKCGLPVLLARKVAAIFREKVTGAGEDPTYISEKKAAKLAARALIEMYIPKDKGSIVHKRLSELSQGKKFLVINPTDGVVDVTASEKLLNEIRDGYAERDTFELGGRPVKVVAVGVEPMKKLVDENPLYPGRVLRPDGTCDQMNRSWEGVPTIVRQLFYIAVTQTGEVRVMNLDKANDLLDMALAADAEQKIRNRYKKASIALDEAVANGSAPKLKISLNEESKPQNPFAIGSNKTYYGVKGRVFPAPYFSFP